MQVDDLIGVRRHRQVEGVRHVCHLQPLGDTAHPAHVCLHDVGAATADQLLEAVRLPGRSQALLEEEDPMLRQGRIRRLNLREVGARAASPRADGEESGVMGDIRYLEEVEVGRNLETVGSLSGQP